MGKPVAKMNIDAARDLCLAALESTREITGKEISARRGGGNMRAIQCALLAMYEEGMVKRHRRGNEYVYALTECEHEDMECDEPDRCPCACASCLDDFDHYIKGDT